MFRFFFRVPPAARYSLGMACFMLSLLDRLLAWRSLRLSSLFLRAGGLLPGHGDCVDGTLHDLHQGRISGMACGFLVIVVVKLLLLLLVVVVGCRWLLVVLMMVMLTVMVTDDDGGDDDCDDMMTAGGWCLVELAFQVVPTLATPVFHRGRTLLYEPLYLT